MAKLIVQPTLLGIFFNTASGIVGHEANYQALLFHQLARRYGKLSIAREFRHPSVGRGAIDIAVIDPDLRDISAAIEIKGGAYGNRNALNDTIEASCYCKDMDRLAKLRTENTEAWFVCVDATELGRSLDKNKLQLTATQCIKRKIGFAYQAHGDKTAFIQSPEGKLFKPELKLSLPVGKPPDSDVLNAGGAVLQKLTSSVVNVEINESDIVGRLYHYLVSDGYSPKQLSLETYFSLANLNNKRMQLRPDLCLFETVIDGQFNLYRSGNRKLSNDLVKLSHLRLLLEAKGGTGLLRKTDNALGKTYWEDVEKLASWKDVMHAKAKDAQIDFQCSFNFLAIDQRTRQLPPEQKQELDRMAAARGIVFNYIHAKC